MMIYRELQLKDIPKLKIFINSNSFTLPSSTFILGKESGILEKLLHSKRSKFWIIEVKGDILGVAGIISTYDVPFNSCKLIYLNVHQRLKGLFQEDQLLQLCISSAIALGYTSLFVGCDKEHLIRFYKGKGFYSSKPPIEPNCFIQNKSWLHMKL